MERGSNSKYVPSLHFYHRRPVTVALSVFPPDTFRSSEFLTAAERSPTSCLQPYKTLTGRGSEESRARIRSERVLLLVPTLASAGKELKDNFLKALAEREEANRSGKMTVKTMRGGRSPSSRP
ncbi:unnamed protein product [Pleuronectes platessa]|uniref:Uncharacterized protein n=1 Tax=Pleuronectes platessa TaxID=8262 RepID=A0A9N7TUI4_PLEPL|nr:unnamed protein product [Pleuronectes platessa]